MSTPAHTTFPRITRWTHAIIALLFIQQYVLITLKKSAQAADARHFWMHYHQSFGVLILGIGVFFILHRLRRGTVRLAPMPWMLTLLARTTHALLWGLILVLPLSGLLMSQWGGYHVPFFQWTLPMLTSPQATWQAYAHDTHGIAATLAFFLILLHGIGALYHHVIMRDNTLTRMRPF